VATRSLNFTVDRTPVDLTLGGDHFDAPAILAPAALGQLLDMQADLPEVFAKLSAAQTGDVQKGAMQEVLEFLAKIFDVIFGTNDDGSPGENAQRFRDRLFSPTNSFDLNRELVPCIQALVEEYAGGRPTVPSQPSSRSLGSDGTSSTDGPPSTASTPESSPAIASAI
jgi:hypothetical protein